LHTQVFVPGPVLAQAAFASQPPLFEEHESTAEQTVPSPAYPVLHVQVATPPLEAHRAVAAHPPLFAAQAPTPVQVIPLPAYPLTQVQEFFPASVLVQVAFGSHPP